MYKIKSIKLYLKYNIVHKNPQSPMSQKIPKVPCHKLYVINIFIIILPHNLKNKKKWHQKQQ